MEAKSKTEPGPARGRLLRSLQGRVAMLPMGFISNSRGGSAVPPGLGSVFSDLSRGAEAEAPLFHLTFGFDFPSIYTNRGAPPLRLRSGQALALFAKVGSDAADEFCLESNSIASCSNLSRSFSEKS